MSPHPDKKTSWFRRLADRTAASVGSPAAFVIALGIVVVWGLTGPAFHYSDTWQLVINTGTTIVTFLMVFLIQATQNRESRAIQLKLDELIRALGAARNVFADLEDATDEELRRFQEEFKRLRERGLSDNEAFASASHQLHSETDDVSGEA